MIRWLFLLLGDFESGLERLLIFPSALLFVLLHFLFCAEDLPWIEDFKSYQNLTSLNRRVLVELVESITVYDKEHIHIQYRFDQEIRNVLEYCSSVQTEGNAV